MQAASGFSEDSHIAYPGLHQEYGVAWQLNETTIVSRKELSDAFLEALEAARAAKLREQALLLEPERMHAEQTAASDRVEKRGA